jgi:MerR family transcriptional regulator, light-induced transcriptional regulator
VAIYSINDLEKLSGIKAHTIRIWEQRYELICPERTKTNIRYYDDFNLKLLLNIALLNKNGIKISKIATMSKGEIQEKVSQISEVNFQYDTQLDAITIAMIEMDEYKFDRILSSNIQQMGFERTIMEVIYPFLERLSLLWLTGSVNPVQEHFMSYLLRQKVIVAIDKEPIVSGKDVKKFLIYLPEGERQELSLLFMHYMLKSRKNHVIYIGQDITLDDLRDTYDIHKPDYVFSLINEPFSKVSIQQYIDSVSSLFEKSQILFSGYQVVNKELKIPQNITVLDSLDDTIKFIDSLRVVNMRRIMVN